MIKDCSSCIHNKQELYANYENSPCAKCVAQTIKRQIVREPNFDLEKNYVAANLVRRIRTVRMDILIYMLEHPDYSQKKMAKRLRIPLSTFNFNYRRIKRTVPEFFQ